MTPLEALMKMKAAFEAAGAEFAPNMPAQDVPAPADAAPVADMPVGSAKVYDLKSGGKITVEKMEIGGKVTIADANGTESPAPAGEYELADGTSISVDDMGAIAEISTATEEAQDPIEDATETAPADMVAEKIAKCEEAIAELKSELAAKKQAMDASEAKFSKAITDLSDIMVGLINTASANPTEQPKDKFEKQVESKEAKMKRFLDFAKNINK